VAAAAGARKFQQRAASFTCPLREGGVRPSPNCRYYGAIHPCEHYFPFWVHNETDVVQLVQQLQGNPDNDLTAQHIAANSQAFALTHLSHEYAFWYWQALRDKYVALYRGQKSKGRRGGRNHVGLVVVLVVVDGTHSQGCGVLQRAKKER